ncbi:MAG: hypothetical protein WC858_06265 [Parcubacteria group bacterium]|jgi:hypothetical protein
MVQVIASATGEGRWLGDCGEDDLAQLIEEYYFGRLEKFEIKRKYSAGHISFSIRALLEIEDYGDDYNRTAELMLKGLILPRVFDDLKVLS